MRLLVAEDVAVSLRMLENFLRRVGHDVVSSENGKVAWEALRADPSIRLVIADWMMPEMDGLELTRKIRSTDSEHYTYVILLTSRGERQDKIDGLQAGADDYVIKPFDPEELTFRIRAGERVIRLEQELAGRGEQLRRLALLDELTGIGNRRAFDETYTRLVAQSQRYGSSLCLAMVDIDRFKDYNDGLGHEAGDQVLKQVAEILMGNIRTADLLFRYGGEEFVCLFPMTAPEGAAIVAERLRSKVEQARISHPANEPHRVVTISLGYSCYRPGAATPPEDLLRLADQALYRCKASGRNRILMYQLPQSAAG